MTTEESLVHKEEQWRKLRAAQFGQHKRRASLPELTAVISNKDALFLMMQLSEQHRRAEETMKAQEEFTRSAGSLTELYTQIESGGAIDDLTKALTKFTATADAQRKLLDERAVNIETMLSRAEQVLQTFSEMLEHHPDATSPKQTERRRSKSIFKPSSKKEKSPKEDSNS